MPTEPTTSEFRHIVIRRHRVRDDGGPAALDQSLRSYMLQVYNWMRRAFWDPTVSHAAAVRMVQLYQIALSILAALVDRGFERWDTRIAGLLRRTHLASQPLPLRI